MLEVPQQNNLPVGLFQLFNSRGEPPLKLMPGGHRRRRQLAVSQAIGQIGLRGIRISRRLKRHLAIEAAGGGHPMPPMGIDDPVTGHVPQPQLKRHRRIGEVVAQPPVRLQHDILHDVAGIDPSLHHPVKPVVNHPSDRGPVSGQQSVDRRSITLPSPVEQDKRLRGRVCRFRTIAGSGHGARSGKENQ